MRALLALLVILGADDPGEARKPYDRLMPPSLHSWSKGLEQIDGVWQCSVQVNVLRSVEEVTDSGNTVSSEEGERLQSVLLPVARKAIQVGGLINRRLGSLDSELVVAVEIYPVDEQSEEIWSTEVRTTLLAPARLVEGGLPVQAPVWTLVLKGAVARADLETVLATAIERTVRAAANDVAKARAATKHGRSQAPTSNGDKKYSNEQER
jgi:hypothetical protein